MRDLYSMTGNKSNLSTAYHPQTDGQTEWINQEVEQYLHLFVNKQQTDYLIVSDNADDEADELIRWSLQLNINNYHTNWKHLATSNVAQ